jgi:hypothetical protein
VQICVPQGIDVLRYEHVIMNANRPIHRRSQWVQDLVQNIGSLPGDVISDIPASLNQPCNLRVPVWSA